MSKIFYTGAVRMSFKEKVVWVMLVIMVLVYGR